MLEERDMSMQWNYGDLFDAVAARVPERTALIDGDRKVSWSAMDQRTNRLARAMLAAKGVEAGDKVALYMKNAPAYLEGTIAGFKSRLVHVNVNYRYVDEELVYLLDNSDATILIYAAEFADHVASLKDQLPKVKLFVEVADGALRNSFATDYETLASVGDGSPLKIERSPDDFFFLYTGGTTGKPKGVMWRHEDRIGVYSRAGATGPEAFIEKALKAEPRVHLPCCPLMHSTGLTSSIDALLNGGAVVLPAHGSLKAADICDAVDAHGVKTLAIVGDAIGRPVLDHLATADPVPDMSSVKLLFSAGVMWSDAVKRDLLTYMPDAMLIDTFGSSEGSGLGSSRTTKDGVAQTGKFQIGAGCKVFTEEHVEVLPGSEVPGLIAKSGNIPVGYYKDPERSARTFPTINGVRYSIPGDWCLVEADGAIKLLGRGSGCINTGGEKVFAEEVEEVLKQSGVISDALVLGVPDPRWGQAVGAVVQTNETGEEVDVGALKAFARDHLADYKIPKKLVVVSQTLRLPNGKPNYDLATEIIGSAA
jgi:3-oxocholest-4-en-26-oate---CoA ligase